MLKFSSSVDDGDSETTASSAAAASAAGEGLASAAASAQNSGVDVVDLCNHVFERLQTLQLATSAHVPGSDSD